MGASAITVVEMIDFAFKCCHFAIWRNKEEAKHKERERAVRFGETDVDGGDGDAQEDAN